jgi:hypothetical protein
MRWGREMRTGQEGGGERGIAMRIREDEGLGLENA